MHNELDRYSTDEMGKIWSTDWKLQTWARIEIEAAIAQGAPDVAVQEMRNACVPTAPAVEAEENVTRHDVVAFLNCWRSGMGKNGQSWTHRNMTSSDLVDTANAMRMKASAEVIDERLEDLCTVLSRQALTYRSAVRVGRTHGQTAEVTTWGWRMAEFMCAVDRARSRFRVLEPFYNVGKLSGPVGDFKRLTPVAQAVALTALDVYVPETTSQIVMRDGYVDYAHVLAQTATTIETIALEVRLSSRTDTGEVAEGFKPGQRGSSAMPHKRNPITAEKLCGLARIVRAQVDPIAQGVASHHERDISHSSVERIALQTASVVADYMVKTCTDMMVNLMVYPKVMRRRVISSPELLSAMIKDALVESGVDPSAAYHVVFNSFAEWGGGFRNELIEILHEHWLYTDPSWTKTPDLVPDFTALIGLLDEPEQLIGHTDGVFEAIGHRLLSYNSGS
jgi:adenylosuccinate lyase